MRCSCGAADPTKFYPYCRHTCKDCQRRRSTNYYHSNKEYRKSYNRLYYHRTAGSRMRKHQLRKLGMNLEDYEKMFLAQGGLCAICHKPDKHRRLAVDHCHKTKQVRKLLCRVCNLLVGHLESPNAEVARQYILAHT